MEINTSESGPLNLFLKKWAHWILMLLSVLIYSNTIGHNFVLDDVAVIGLNKVVQQGISGIPTILKTSLFYGYNDINEGTYRPIMLIVLAIEKSAFGNNPMAFHIVNILLYAISIGGLFYTLRKFNEHLTLPLFGATLLFCLHPIHTEVVANIKSMDEILALLFFSCCLYSAYSYRIKSGIFPLIGIFIFYSAALLSKESALSFLLLIPLLLLMKKHSADKRLGIIISIMLLATGMYFILRLSLFGSVSNINLKIDKIDNIMTGLPFLRRFTVAVSIIGQYLLQSIYPWQLSHDYSFNELKPYKITDPAFLLSFTAVVILIAAGIRAIVRKQWIFLGGLFFLLSLSVVSNIPILIGVARADRLLFIPIFGICFSLSLILLKAINTFISGRATLYFASLGMLSLVYIVRTWTRNMDWKNNLALYRADIKEAPNSARTHYHLGNELWQLSMKQKDTVLHKSMLEEAKLELNKSLEIYADYPDAIVSIGNVFHELGQYDQEISVLNKNAAEGKSSVEMLYNTANARLQQGDITGAITSYKQAIDLKPDNYESYVNIGSAYLQASKPDSAIIYLEKAKKMRPEIPQIYTNLASAYQTKGDVKRCMQNLDKSLAMEPNQAEGYALRGSIELNQHQLAKAEKSFEKSLKVKPNYIQSRYNLGVVYIQQKRYSPALEQFQEVLKVEPQYREALINSGYALQMMHKDVEAINYYERVISIYPNDGNTLRALESLYKKQGNMQKAQEYGQRAK